MPSEITQARNGTGSKTKRSCGVDRRRSPQSGLSQAVQAEAQEYVWLDYQRAGISPRAIARRERLSVRRIQLGLARARRRENASRSMESRKRDILHTRDGTGPRVQESPPPFDLHRKQTQPPRLVPLFPIGPFTPSSVCPHQGPIRRGSVICCMVCSRSGMDDHPALKRDPSTDPSPEPKTVLAPKPAHGRETRRERRKRLFAASTEEPSQACAQGN
jgi:hypothetical protein